jgi:hypothetical protein
MTARNRDPLPLSTDYGLGPWPSALSSTTAIFWGWAHFTGRLPEPERAGVEAKEIEIHGEPTV